MTTRLHAATLAAPVRSEVVKVVTVRGLWMPWVLVMVAAPLVALLIVDTDGLGPSDTVASGSVSGFLVPLAIWVGWAAWLSGGEYSRGTIEVSTSVVPHRARFVWSKLIAAVLLAVPGAVISVGMSVLVVAAAIPPGGHRFGSIFALVWVPVIVAAVVIAGVSVGFLTRSGAGGAALGVVALLIPKGAGDLLGGLQSWVVGASPATVIAQVVDSPALADTERFPAGGAIGALITVSIIVSLITAAALYFTGRRDI